LDLRGTGRGPLGVRGKGRMKWDMREAKGRGKGRRGRDDTSTRK